MEKLQRKKESLIEKNADILPPFVELFSTLLSGANPVLMGIGKFILGSVGAYRLAARIDNIETWIDIFAKHEKELSALLGDKHLGKDFHDPVVSQFYRFLEKLVDEEDRAKSSAYFNIYYNLAMSNFQNIYRATQYHQIVKDLSIAGLVWLLDIHQNEEIYKVAPEDCSADSGKFPIDTFLQRYKNQEVNENVFFDSCPKGYLMKISDSVRDLLEIDEYKITSMGIANFFRFMGTSGSKLGSLSQRGKDFCHLIFLKNSKC